MTAYETIGRHFFRGGKKIELEKEEEYFTCYLEDEAQLENVRALPGVHWVRPVQNKIFKIQVSASDRDAVMSSCRSEKIGTVCHHAYRPKDATNTRYYLSDLIIAKFKAGLSDQDVEKILKVEGVRLLKEYPGNASMFLLQVTSSAGKNPIKVSNLLAAHGKVEWAEPNLINRFQKFHTPHRLPVRPPMAPQQLDGPGSGPGGGCVSHQCLGDHEGQPQHRGGAA